MIRPCHAALVLSMPRMAAPRASAASCVGQIARFGLKEGPNALHVGDEITVTCTPAADGKSPVGLLVAITYQDGHTVRFRSPDE